MSAEPENLSLRDSMIPGLSLFTSMGTLICCALPALLVTLGAGATLASIVSTAPWLVALSKYKLWMFGVSGSLIVFAGVLQWNMRHAPCPADPAQAKACQRMRSMSQWIYGSSLLVWMIGFFFAFVAVHVFY